MSLFKSEKTRGTLVNVDELLQDSYLLVVELRQGASTSNSDALWELCVQQIEGARQALKDSGMGERSIDHISHAQCALLDESAFAQSDEKVRSKWSGEPLQAKFFNRHQAGQFLYEEMREVLREPAPDPCVLKVYQRVLLLGFKGRYGDLDHPERMRLVTELEERVAPLQLDRIPLNRLLAGRPRNPVRWLLSPVSHALAVSLLLAATWFGLDQHLADLIGSFTPVGM